MSGRKKLSDDDSSASSVSSDTSWISWYCSLRGNEFFCQIDREFIDDDFNLTGLSTMVPNYEFALDMILDVEIDEGLTEEQQELIESAAEALYGLIHARFILTSRGLAFMVEKYNNVDFGRCPRVLCHGQPVLPVGQSDIPRTNTAKIYCAKCNDIYYPKYSRHANIDGAYFGTTFPHLLIQTYPELVVARPTQVYVPRIFGFKIHSSMQQPGSGSSIRTAAPTTSSQSTSSTSSNVAKASQQSGAGGIGTTATPSSSSAASNAAVGAASNASTTTNNSNNNSNNNASQQQQQ